MAFFLTPTASNLSQTPPINEALSGIFGSVSLTAWICLLLPQLIANYKSQSADGLSMAFLFVWLIGDVANLTGALFTHLAPTAIALACYFCIADVVLISQCLYYNAINANRASRSVLENHSDRAEDSPLLSRRRRSSSMGLPGSHRHHSMHTESSLEPLRRIITGEDETEDSSPCMHNFISLLAVFLIGYGGWLVSYKIGAWDSDAGNPSTPAAQQDATIGVFLGYFSAACYLCARIPQIIKNYQEKSCEGLALLFFLLSLMGNLTYGISLVAYSQDGDYLLNALPWLLGSLGTMVEDCIIFAQFKIYASNRRVSVLV